MKRCGHKLTSHIVCYALDNGEILSVYWCLYCGAVKRMVNYQWCGGEPTWETPEQARAEVTELAVSQVRGLLLNEQRRMKNEQRRTKIIKAISKLMNALDNVK